MTFLLISTTLLVGSIQPVRTRSWMLFGLAALYPIAGLQVVAFAVVLCLLLWIYLGMRFIRLALPIAAGVVTGLISLLAFYAANGVVMVFLTSTVASGHSLSGDLAQLVVLGDAKVRGRVQGRLDALLSLWRLYRLDASFVPLLIAAIAAQVGLRVARVPVRRSVSSFGLVAAVVVGPFMLLAGKYPFYYSWMGFLPLAVAAVRSAEELWEATHLKKAVAAVGVPGVFGALVGLPWILWNQPLDRKNDLDRIDAFVRETVQPHEWVYGRPSAFYAVKAHAGEFFHDQYAGSRRFASIPEDQRNRISVILTSPDQLPIAVAKLGGDWAPTGQMLRLAYPTLPDAGSINPLIATTQDVDLLNVDLHVYRRRE